MYRYIGGMASYDLLNTIAIVVMLLSSLFFYKSKKEVAGLLSTQVIELAERKSSKLGKAASVLLLSIESFLMAGMVTLASSHNMEFGALVGTGGNYFGLLIYTPIYIFILSSVLLINPLKQLDITTMIMPIFLFFVKMACFLNGCCWGIPWEYGFYNHNPYHTNGREVPVQAIEAIWGIVIFLFLLWYRKKAKAGTMYPMYLILYSTTRFFSEFFRHEENVLWIFKTYHLLCLAGIAVGVLLLIIVPKFENVFLLLYNLSSKKILSLKEQKSQKLAAEAELLKKKKAENLEKAKLARAKSKARKK